jgi:hypothetical protein
MRAKSVNELAEYEEKNPHENFQKAKEILLEELRKIVDLDAELNIVSGELIRLLGPDKRGEELDEHSWKIIFMEEYLEPMVNHLEALQEVAYKLKGVEEVGDIYNDLKPKKKTFMDRLKNLKHEISRY